MGRADGADSVNAGLFGRAAGRVRIALPLFPFSAAGASPAEACFAAALGGDFLLPLLYFRHFRR